MALQYLTKALLERTAAHFDSASKLSQFNAGPYNHTSLVYSLTDVALTWASFSAN
jgi:hypothetical protein